MGRPNKAYPALYNLFKALTTNKSQVSSLFLWG